MLGKQGNDETLYLKREDGKRGLESMRDIYNEIRLRVACYMSKSENRWTQPTWRMETLKVENGAMTEARTTIGEVAMRLKFDDNVM